MSKVRPITFEEQLSLSHWHGTTNMQTYMIARILLLAQKAWSISDIAFAFLVNEEIVKDTIQIFNQNGLQALCFTSFSLPKVPLYPNNDTRLDRK